MAFSPVNASKDITKKYTRYLSTIFSLADPEYQKLFEQRLGETPFSKGPFLEVTDAFQKGPTIMELIDQGELPVTFDRLGFHANRPLYRHQVDSLRKLASVPSTCDIILSISERGRSPRGITSVTRIVPSVIVPVLSRHTISALASISIEYIS